MMGSNNSYSYLLLEENEVINRTEASSVEKAIDYFKSIGYDIYSNPDLSIKPFKESYHDMIEKIKEDSGDSWDKWHPHY